MIQQQRIWQLNRQEAQEGTYVLYWMQSSQRVEYNHALEFAIQKSNERRKPLLVYFGLTDGFPEANERHYTFMLEGLQEVQLELERRKIRFLVRHISPEQGALELSKNADLLIVDRGYLRIERQWRAFVAKQATCPVIQVETNVILPVEEVSPKEEYAAATIRRKIHTKLPDYAIPLRETVLQRGSLSLELPFTSLDIGNIKELVSKMDIDHSVKSSPYYIGGTSRARTLLDAFLVSKLPQFADKRNDPGSQFSSDLSPYLHFGQLSPLYIYERVKNLPLTTKDAFLEELIVRRELSMNFVYYNPSYDSYDCIPDWAKNTLSAHERDPRGALYSLEELEQANTSDPYWNAAQTELLVTGKMHGYMRMYWGKKILEWTSHPRLAYERALYLNNKYQLDGRDPNGFAGVAWCFGKHDRPWQERPIFGMVRYMNDKGLARKFNMKSYLLRIKNLE